MLSSFAAVVLLLGTAPASAIGQETRQSFIDFSTLFNMCFFHACELSHVVCLARIVFCVYTATPRSAELELTPRLKQGLP